MTDAFTVYGGVMTDAATHVEVTMRDGRTLWYPGCTMDQLTPGVLTITDAAGADDLVVVLGRGTWLVATAYDAQGHPDVVVTASEGVPQ